MMYNRPPVIGIVGYGFVGQAVSYGFSPCQQVIVDPKHTFTSVADLVECDAIFVCVPTPMDDNGKCDTSILQSVLEEIRALEPHDDQVILLKSTVPPSVLEQLRFGEGNNDSQLEVYNPEFLTERAANHDFVHPEIQIFGGAYTEAAEFVYEYSICSPPKHVFHGTVVEASIAKYMINTFLATKVEFFNEWKDYADKKGARFANIANIVGADPRIGMSHTKVPGPDGRFGFGGSCFPKDLSAALSEEMMPLLSVVKTSNNNRRQRYKLDQREIDQNVSWEK